MVPILALWIDEALQDIFDLLACVEVVLKLSYYLRAAWNIAGRGIGVDRNRGNGLAARKKDWIVVTYHVLVAESGLRKQRHQIYWKHIRQH